MSEGEIEIAAMAVLVKFVQFGELPSEGDLTWAKANADLRTPEYLRARRYAMAALGVDDQ
jgi:hypothetical protein